MKGQQKGRGAEGANPTNREGCEHHWVASHQPDFPQGIYWIRQCSACLRIDGADLAAQVGYRGDPEHDEYGCSCGGGCDNQEGGL